MSKLPDFLIIGAMKSATTSLQEQLALHSGIYMCTPKEPNFFSDDDNFSMGLSWYSSLFSAAAPENLLGEASTHYTKLPTYPHTVERLKHSVPNAKLVYVMRHPVERLVSHFIHDRSMGAYNASIDQAIDRYPELVAYGQYSVQLAPFIEAFGYDAICPVFFDRLLQSPQSELERVCDFIGYQGQVNWMTELPPSNVSSERIRRFPLYSYLVDSSPATALRRLLIPKSLRSMVKKRLTMRERPVLSDKVSRRLNDIFDEDLLVLGKWLGVSLNCENFKDITTQDSLNWVETRV